MPRILAILGVLAATAVAWLAYQQSRPVPFVVSGFIEADAIRVGSRIGGRVAEASVAEGDSVRPGQLLYRLDPFDLNQRLAQAEAERAGARAEHRRLLAGYRPEEIEQARAVRDRVAAALSKAVSGPRKGEIEIARETVKRAQADLQLAESENERLAGLAKQGQAAQTEMDRAQRELKAARASLASAEQSLALLVEGTRSEEIAEAKALLAEAEEALKLLQAGYRQEDITQADAKAAAAEAEVEAIRVQLAELSVVSPCHCVVEAIDLHPGDFVARDAPSVSLLDLKRLWVRTYVPENRLGEIDLSKTVPVRVDGFGGRTFRGRITFIAREAEFTPRNVQTPEERSKQVFRIKVQLEQGLDELRVGMMADVLLGEAAGPG